MFELWPQSKFPIWNSLGMPGNSTLRLCLLQPGMSKVLLTISGQDQFEVRKFKLIDKVRWVALRNKIRFTKQLKEMEQISLMGRNSVRPSSYVIMDIMSNHI